jgi:hypothetical protein
VSIVPRYEELVAWAAGFCCARDAPEAGPEPCGACIPCRAATAYLSPDPKRGDLVLVVHEFEAQYLGRRRGRIRLGDVLPDDPVSIEFDPNVVKLVPIR